MKHVDDCKALLEQLKKDYPLPETVTLFVDFQPGCRATIGRSVGGSGLIRVAGRKLPLQQAKLAIAMGAIPASRERKLETVAHEYRHAYQAFVLNTYTNTSNPLDKSEDDAREFANTYVEEYLKRND